MSVDLVDDTSVDEPNPLLIVRVMEEEPIGPAAPAATPDDTEIRILTALTADAAVAPLHGPLRPWASAQTVSLTS